MTVDDVRKKIIPLRIKCVFSLCRRSQENKEISGGGNGNGSSNSRSESGFSIEDSLAKRFQMVTAAAASQQQYSTSTNEMEKPHEKFLKQIICGECSTVQFRGGEASN